MNESILFPSDPEGDEGAVKFIADAVKNPYKPNKCTLSLTSALFAIVPHKHFPKVWEEKAFSKRGFFEVLFTFIAAERTPEQTRDMIKGRRTCADCADNARGRTMESALYHTMGKGQSYLYSLMYEEGKEMERFIGLALDVITRLLSSIEFKTLARRYRTSWPFTITDLMLHGPDQIAAALYQIYDIARDRFIMTTACYILSLCRSRVYLSFCHQPFIEVAAQRLKFDIDTMIDQIKSGHLASKAGMAVSALADSGGPFFEFLKCSMQPHVEMFYSLKLLDGNEDQCLQISSMFLYLLKYLKKHAPSTKAKDIEALEKEAIEVAGTMLQGLIPRHWDFVIPRYFPRMPLHPGIVDFDDAINFGIVDGFKAEIGLAAFLPNLLENQCGFDPCDKRLESVGANFKKCSRCFVVFYCSIECQTKAWKNTKNAHKQLCPVLRKVHDILYPPPQPNANPASSSSGDSERTFFDRLKDASSIRDPTLEKVKVIHAIIEQARLSAGETKLLHDWGITIGVWNRVMKATSQLPGFEEYESRIAWFTDPKGPVGGPQAKNATSISNLPFTAEPKQEKAELLRRSLGKRV